MRKDTTGWGAGDSLGSELPRRTHPCPGQASEPVIENQEAQKLPLI